MTNGQTDGRARAIPMYVPSNSVGSGQLHLHLPGVNELNIFYDCQLLSWRRVHFTYNSLVIQNSWKITFSVIPFLFTISLHNFACVTTAQLLWHMQNFVMISIIICIGTKQMFLSNLLISMKKRLWKWPRSKGAADSGSCLDYRTRFCHCAPGIFNNSNSLLSRSSWHWPC